MNDNNLFRSWLGKILTPGVPANQTGSFQNEAYIRSILKESKQKRHEMNRSIKEIPFTFLDTETTGFHADAGDEIISIALAQSINGKVNNEYYSYINPNRNIPPHITELTKIEQTHVEKAPSLSSVMNQVLSLLSGSVIIGYHIQHDLNFLNYFLWNHGRLKLTQQTVELRQVVEALHQKTFQTLDDALMYYGIICEARHDAQSDVHAMLKLWMAILQVLQQKHIDSLYDLYALLNTKS